MASEDVHKQEFRIRDLPTRSVLLFPQRAQIIRDIKEITLRPGANQIVIDGLAPTVDEHSIKVEGTGAATITDVVVELLPNREVFEDIYPSDTEDEDEDEDEDESDAEEEAMREIVEKIKKLQTDNNKEQEKIASSASRLRICENFGSSVANERPAPDQLGSLLNAYDTEREKIYKDHALATKAIEDIRAEIAKAEKAKIKLAKEIVKAAEKKKKEAAKLKEKKMRKKAEIFKEKQRVKAERESFWPKKVYKVTINLEPSTLTPGSSRRSSIDGDTVVNLATSTFHEQSDAPLKTDEISLSLSYITYSASWSPRYDLSLSTTKSSGLLEYGAELKNTTSETWRDAKVILSTSQTTFSGLSETIPILEPWHVRLIKNGQKNVDGALMSKAEISSKHREWNTHSNVNQKPRWELFGNDNSAQNAFIQQQPKLAMARQAHVQAQAMQVADRTSVPMSSGFGSTASVPPNGLRFGRLQINRTQDAPQPPAPARAARAGGLFGGAVRSEKVEAEESDEDMGCGLFDDSDPAPNSLAFEAGAWEETGMTTTYDVPGTKTLTPSNSTIKHKIAKVDFRNVVFSHIVIGKLRQVAFLKARLRNSSKITLLKGPLGLTLDGSFLGQATFPRCSAGETFSLPLGVDPAINIAYPKPTVRRSQTGIFSKEDSNVFTRTVVITNTKANAPVELTVLDQVPVSEDERLRIEITNPLGLKPGGDGTRTGTSATAAQAGGNGKGTSKDVRASVYGGGASDGKWGSAVATAKKGGEVSWNVKLNPSQAVKLVLEYEATFPGTESVVGL